MSLQKLVSDRGLQVLKGPDPSLCEVKGLFGYGFQWNQDQALRTIGRPFIALYLS